MRTLGEILHPRPAALRRVIGRVFPTMGRRACELMVEDWRLGVETIVAGTGSLSEVDPRRALVRAEQAGALRRV